MKKYDKTGINKNAVIKLAIMQIIMLIAIGLKVFPSIPLNNKIGKYTKTIIMTPIAIGR